MTNSAISAHASPEQILDRADSLYHCGKCDEAVDLLIAASRQITEDRRFTIRLAELLLDSDQSADAVSVLQTIPSAEDDYDLVALTGRCQAGMGDFNKALQSADQLMASKHYHASAFYLQGIVAYHTGDLQKAENFFRKVIELDPYNGEAYQHLGLLKKQAGEPEAAMELLQAGFNCAPTARSVVLAYHNEITAQSDFDRAGQFFREAIDRYPGNQRLRYLYIDMMLRNGQLRSAMDVIENCLGIFGPDPGLLNAALEVRDKLEPMESAAPVRSGPRISLCMITRNEERHLSRCLASAKKIVDEIIIVDTGSEDRTMKIARAFGAKLFEYVWDNDFARARNFSLSQATCDWIVVLDADECIAEEDGPRLRSLLNQPANSQLAFSVMTRNYTHQANLVGWQTNDGRYGAQEAGTGWYPSQKVRCFPNNPNIRFSYPIHELVEPSLKKLDIEIELCPIPVHHYGKLNEKENEEKALAYYRLGKKKLADLGDNAVALRELAVQAAGLGKFGEAVEFWQRYIVLEPEAVEAYINMGTASWQIADYGNAARYAEKAISLAPGLKEAHFNFALANLYRGDGDGAIEILEKLLKHHQSYLAARFILAAAYACTAAEEKARNAFKQLLHQISDFELQTAVSEVVDRLKSAKLNRYAQNLMQFS